MLVDLDCIPCLLRVSLRVGKMVSEDPAIMEKLFKMVLMKSAEKGINTEKTSPEIAEVIFKEGLTMGPNKDPFFKVKEEQNRIALKLYPWAKDLVQDAEDPFAMAVKLAMAGNLLDSLTGTDVLGFRQEMEKVLDKAVSSKELSDFRKKVESSRLILYLGDNCGEIVFDRLLIETIKEMSDAEVVFVVRSEPTYNDVTLKEASEMGIDRIARVIENGISGPLPGTILQRCSQQMRDLCNEADLIIAKGGGNLETLAMGSQWGITKDTTFLTMAKCSPQCAYFNTEMYEPILKNMYDHPRPQRDSHY